MRLSDIDIKAALSSEKILISPRPGENSFGASDIDLTLDRNFLIFDVSPEERDVPWGIDEEGRVELPRMKKIEIEEKGVFNLHRGEVALGVTVENVTIPDDMVAILDGRSGLARYGVMVHVTAHTVKPGFSGPLVLEFVNFGPRPYPLKAGCRICTISFEKLTSKCEKPYGKNKNSKYQNQSGVTASRIGHETLIVQDTLSGETK